MKKFYAFLFAAVALVGFAACNSDNTEEPAPAGVEKVSFTANIEQTKTGLDAENKTTWANGDKVTVTNEEVGSFVFTFNEETNTFDCVATGVTGLLGKEVTAAYNEGKLDSTAGVAGAILKATEAVVLTENAVLNFAVESAFLKLTTTGTVTLKGAGLFSTGDELEIQGENAETVYVAINPAENVAFSCETKGMELKNTTITFNAKTIYNLGELTGLGDAHEMFGIVGAHQGWNTETPDALYLIPGSNTYVRYNVTLADGGFKFYGYDTEIKIIEHPEVTGGETGDWYLVPNSNWKVDNARFAIYFFGTSGNTWVDMKDENGDGIYVGNNPATGTYESLIFCRMNPSATANDWNNKWNQTADLKIANAGSNNCYTVKAGTWDNGGGTWSVHTPVEHQDAWTEEVETIVPYWIGFNEYSGDITNWATGWSNSEMDNITVGDYTKTYDIYFQSAKEDWGYTGNYTVLEHGSAAPELK